MRTPDHVLGAGAWLLENGHRSLLKLTGGRFPRKILGMKTVELHTTGRKSGKAYSTMLTTPVHDEQRIVLVASKGGSQDHPDWYKNLVANPDVLLTLDDRNVPMRARTASHDERATLWPAVVAAYKGYGGYQRNTDREIPLVICEPRTQRWFMTAVGELFRSTSGQGMVRPSQYGLQAPGYGLVTSWSAASRARVAASDVAL